MDREEGGGRDRKDDVAEGGKGRKGRTKRVPLTKR